MHRRKIGDHFTMQCIVFFGSVFLNWDESSVAIPEARSRCRNIATTYSADWNLWRCGCLCCQLLSVCYYDLSDDCCLPPPSSRRYLSIGGRCWCCDCRYGLQGGGVGGGDLLPVGSNLHNCVVFARSTTIALERRATPAFDRVSTIDTAVLCIGPDCFCRAPQLVKHTLPLHDPPV